MTGTRDLLNYWLGRCYEAEVIKGDRSGTAPALLAAQLQANQDLMADAKLRSQEITEDMTKQCFITKKHSDFLRVALAAPTT